MSDAMIRGLRIVMGAEDLTERINQRIAMHESATAALDARLKEREGDMPIDVRMEDDFKTVDEIRRERERLRDRVTQLTLLRDSLICGETYTLNRSDLRYAELISPDSTEGIGDGDWVDCGTGIPIDGLKLTLPGEELRTLLQARQTLHERRAASWRKERERTPEEQTDDTPLLPDHICENSAEEHEWRAAVLGFIRDHIESEETYRLGEADLAFGELLPEKPGWMQQEEYEEGTSIGHNVERLTGKAGELGSRELAGLTAASDE